MEPKIAQKGPYITRENAGNKKAWCSCGYSLIQPFCDGSHKKLNTGMSPIVVTIKEDGEVFWCGCKHSRNKPYCDGTHKTL